GAAIHPADPIGATACASPDTSASANPGTGSDSYSSGADCYHSGTDSDGHYSHAGSDHYAGSDTYCSGADNHFDSCIERGPGDNHHDNDNNNCGRYPWLYQLYEQLRCREDGRLCDRT